ncbi:hypothetical protein [Agarilytica rhodophyticola]|uniref:hypothetical protein n=1 Tax=Agarilytica rhodophyticola TaxID=1737490 RepID=UPI000B34355A|nr:hypothetical protein [Agarilytica rhodophyticola]
MKQEIIDQIEGFRVKLKQLKKEVNSIPGERVSRKVPMALADEIASIWVEELRSPIEHKVKLDSKLIQETAEHMRQLHILSRPNNYKKSYLKTINSVLRKFDDKFILPIKQSYQEEVDSSLSLHDLIPNLATPEESDYLKEAFDCASSGFNRAAIVLGWCAVIHKIQERLIFVGLDTFNKTSTKLKASTKGKYKFWKKEYSISSLSELQTVFDTDLIVILEGMELIDGNQAERLRTCFQYRNHSAHPGEAPIEEPNMIAFFSDINSIVLNNEKFR